MHSTAQPTASAFLGPTPRLLLGLVCPVAPSTSPPSSPTISRHVVSQTHRRGPSSTALMYAAQPNGADSATINPAALNTGTSLAPLLLFLVMDARWLRWCGMPSAALATAPVAVAAVAVAGLQPCALRCASSQSQISASVAALSSRQSAFASPASPSTRPNACSSLPSPIIMPSHPLSGGPRGPSPAAALEPLCPSLPSAAAQRNG